MEIDKNSIDILNIKVLCISKNELLSQLKSGTLITPNIDHLVKLQSDKEFYDIYNNTEWVVCDSKILFFLTQLQKKKLPEAIPGSSFFTSYYEYHKDDTNCKIFLLGAAAGIAQKAKENINKKIGRNIIVGAHSPSFGFEKNEEECKKIIELINKSEANVLVIGVGAPKQEKWIYKYKNEFIKIKLFMCLGATIDFEAGTLKRAPTIFQELGLEWLYRFIKEPKRLFKRYFIDDMKFFYYYFKQILGLYQNPFH